MLRRCVTLYPPGASAPRHNSGQMQRPRENVWMIRENMSPRQIWAYVQKEYLNHKVLGFAARCGLFGAVLAGLGVVAYRGAIFFMEDRPLFQQWLPRYREITFMERIPEGNTDMWIYRFALPNSYDYLGHKAIASVEIMVDNHLLFPARRWYTPISHPEQRGIVEFAIKHHTPGELSAHFRTLEAGDKMLMGPWIKEWRYKPNHYKDVAFLCGNSGITPCLQLLVSALDDPSDKTRFSLLYCNRAPDAIPFKKKLEAIQARYPDRFKLTFTVTGGVKDTKTVIAESATKVLQEHGQPSDRFSAGALKGSAMAYDLGESGKIAPVQMMKSEQEGYDGWVGMVNRDLVMEAIPPPSADVMVLACGPQAFMSNLCGRPVGLLRYTYVEGFYHGILKDMGYKWRQVYKFGTSWTNTFASVA
jgi:NAD(P)H-flavin reductase